MSKLLAVVATLVVMFVVAAPAGAQRDPFEPLVKPGGSVSVSDPADDGGAQPIPADIGASGALATTGSDASNWVAVAYGLIGIGGAALLLAYARRTPEAARSRPSRIR